MRGRHDEASYHIKQLFGRDLKEQGFYKFFLLCVDIWRRTVL
jgi:hypothetical protein